MYGMPSGMPALLSQSHQIRTYAAIYQRPWPPHTPQQAAVSPWAWVGAELVPISPLPVQTGTVTIDNTGVQRRRATLTVAPTKTVLPTSVLSDLTPFRNMVLLYYVVGAPDAVLPTNQIPAGAYLLGIFTLTDVDVDLTNSGDVTISMELQDMSQDISRRTLRAPYVTQNGMLMTQAVKDLLNFASSTGLPLPWFSAEQNNALTSGGEGPDTLYAAGYTWDEGQDPWQACQQMAEACGMQLYFTPTGVCEMSYIPNPATTPTCWTYYTGEIPGSVVGDQNAAGVLVGPMVTSCKRTFSQSQVFNYVEYVVEGANANPSPDLLYVGTSFLAQLGDTDPQSPTNIYGPYGIAADVQYDQINYQPSTAMIAAKARLRRDLGAADMVTFTAMPNPAHEAYDVVHVLVPEIGLDQMYVIDTVDLPLDAGKDMTVTARRVVNVP